jgi:hypothetical protein
MMDASAAVSVILGSSQLGTHTKKSAVKNSGLFGGVPSGTRTHGLQIHNLAR